jgi:hypothetical protein
MQTPQPSTTISQKQPKLLDQVRHKLRVLHYSYNTEKDYTRWILRFIYFHNKRHPAEMGEKEIRDFLTHLAAKEKVAASTQSRSFGKMARAQKTVSPCCRKLSYLLSKSTFKKKACGNCLTKKFCP